MPVIYGVVWCGVLRSGFGGPLCAKKSEKGITAVWRSPNGGRNSKTGWDLQNRVWLPPIDRQAHNTHAHFFSSNQLQRKLRPTDDSKDFIGCVNHSVNLISYTMLQKMLTPKPTPHLTLTLTSEIGCTAGVALKRKLQFRISKLCDMRSPRRAVRNSPTGPHRIMAPF